MAVKNYKKEQLSPQHNWQTDLLILAVLETALQFGLQRRCSESKFLFKVSTIGLGEVIMYQRGELIAWDSF